MTDIQIIRELITAIKNGTATGVLIAQFSDDYDHYNFEDAFDTFEDAFEFFDRELTTATGRADLIKGLEEILRNEV